MDGISRGGRFDQKHSKMMLVVKGLVVGAFGEGSEDLHTLIHHLATSRVRVAGPQKGKRGQVRTEEAELAITTSFLRKTLSVAGVRAHAKLLLSRLEVIGPVAGGHAAAGRRSYAPSTSKEEWPIRGGLTSEENARESSTEARSIQD